MALEHDELTVPLSSGFTGEDDAAVDAEDDAPELDDGGFTSIEYLTAAGQGFAVLMAIHVAVGAAALFLAYTLQVWLFDGRCIAEWCSELGPIAGVYPVCESPPPC